MSDTNIYMSDDFPEEEISKPKKKKKSKKKLTNTDEFYDLDEPAPKKKSKSRSKRKKKIIKSVSRSVVMKRSRNNGKRRNDLGHSSIRTFRLVGFNNESLNSQGYYKSITPSAAVLKAATQWF